MLRFVQIACDHYRLLEAGKVLHFSHVIIALNKIRLEKSDVLLIPLTTLCLEVKENQSPPENALYIIFNPHDFTVSACCSSFLEFAPFV